MIPSCLLVLCRPNSKNWERVALDKKQLVRWSRCDCRNQLDLGNPGTCPCNVLHVRAVCLVCPVAKIAGFKYMELLSQSMERSVLSCSIIVKWLAQGDTGLSGFSGLHVWKGPVINGEATVNEGTKDAGVR